MADVVWIFPAVKKALREHTHFQVRC